MRRSGLLALVAAVVLVSGCATAALLPDGRVLLLSAVAKIYDPATGSVTNAAPPPTLRIFGTTTALANGLVLIAGGTSNLGSGFSMGGLGGPAEPTPTPATDSTLASAELYDPATDSYTLTGSMVNGRAFHTATLLADGRVLIVGGGRSTSGEGSSGTGVPSPEDIPPPEIYDPATGTFSLTSANTVTPHAFHTATLLQDGRVLIAGGITTPEPGSASPAPDGGSSGVATTAAELFDPATGAFAATGAMTSPRIWDTATLLADGRVLLVGGLANPNLSATTDGGGAADTTPMSAEVYDPASGTFSPTGASSGMRVGHTANLLGDGHVLVAGGLAQSDGSQSQDPFSKGAELFDPTAGAFAPTGDMVEGQAFHTGTTLQDGKVLLAGFGAAAMQGMMGSGGSSPDLLTTAQLYDPATGTFSAVQVEPAILPSAPPQ